MTRLPKAPFLTSSPIGERADGSPVSGPIAAITTIDWQQFHNFLLQRMTAKTASDKIRYAKKYAHILINQNLIDVQQLSPTKRLHVQKALSNLARFLGRYDEWQATCRKYQLGWSTGTEKLDAFTRFFDSSKDLDTMLAWLKQAIAVLPSDYANFLLFCTMTGMRYTEAVESVRLICKSTDKYYNSEQNILQHYRFPELFIRRTKAVYISVVNDSIVEIAKSIGKVPGSSALKWQCSHRCLSMRVKYCRKIHASWLHKCGVNDSLIDMLQGRIGKNIFLRHYLTPSSDYKQQVLKALEKLQRQL